MGSALAGRIRELNMNILVLTLLCFLLLNNGCLSSNEKHEKRKKKDKHGHVIYPLANISFATSTLIWVSSIEDLPTHILHTAR